MDEDWTAGQVAACVLGALVCAAIVVYAAMYTPRTELDDVVADKRVAGQPLDAYEVDEYSRPLWLPECDRALKVVDRQTGDSWWLLRCDGDWVSMPTAGSGL